jgi:hypothetical protein
MLASFSTVVVQITPIIRATLIPNPDIPEESLLLRGQVLDYMLRHRRFVELATDKIVAVKDSNSRSVWILPLIA